MKPKKIDISSMLKKLDDLYNKEDELKKEFIRLKYKWKQLQDDKEMLQNFIMYQSNKLNRIKTFRR